MNPGALQTIYPVCDLDADVRSVLGFIRVPTLVFHRRDNSWIPVAFGRYLAQHIADARFVEIRASITSTTMATSTASSPPCRSS